MLLWESEFALEASFSPSLKESLFTVNCGVQEFRTNNPVRYIRLNGSVLRDRLVNGCILRGFNVQNPTADFKSVTSVGMSFVLVFNGSFPMLPSPHNRAGGEDRERLRQEEDELLRPPRFPLHQAAKEGVHQRRGQNPRRQAAQQGIHLRAELHCRPGGSPYSLVTSRALKHN